MLRISLRAQALLLACSLWGSCGGHGRSVAGGATVVVPETLDQASFEALSRSYYLLPADDPQRSSVRERLVTYLLAQAADVHAAHEYEAAVEKLAHITSFYLPSELAQAVSPRLLPLAKYVRAEGERRGDEARVLSALWLQRKIEPDAAEAQRQYELVRSFGREAREHLSLAERYGGLIEVQKEHARLTPAPKVLAELADLLETYRREIVTALSPERGGPPVVGQMNYQDYREATAALTRAPFDIAGVYLRHDDFDSALARLRRLDSITRLEPRVRAWVRKISAGESDAPQALITLSIEYAEQDQSDVSLALCRYGRRTYPEESQFSRCLARLAAASTNYAEATANYADAIRVAPEDRGLYDEALQVLDNLMRGDIFEGDAEQTRAMAREASAILRERAQRWPDDPPPVAFADLEMAIGLAEMNAGNADEARAHLEASVERGGTTRALVQLGQLEARLGQRERALGHLRRALQKTSRRGVEALRLRAQILEQIGDVERLGDAPAEAEGHYREALALWEEAERPTDDPAQRAYGHIRRGVLLARLGRFRDSHATFELAIRAAPDSRETYAQILSHLVVSQPAADLAAEILRRAQRELTLDPEWRAYFALWLQAICAREEEALPDQARKQLERLGRSDAWWGTLARFGAGKIDQTKLFSLAKTRGERAEAAFYAGTRRLSEGAVGEAKQLFQQVMDSHMVGFYEYQMAQELLRLDDDVLRAPPASVAAAPPATSAATD